MIAILGATGTIGRALARHYSAGPEPLVLFARRPEVLAGEFHGPGVSLRLLDTFAAHEFDTIFSAIGAGDPARVQEIGAGIIALTELWDERVLQGLRSASTYVFLSSGVVHETDLATPSPYIVAKREAESRHRRARDRCILDLRVFGFVDRTLPLSGNFFLCDLARCVAAKIPFVTSPEDFIRDYTGVAELTQLFDCWHEAGAPNEALDLYSKGPLRKSALLHEARSRYGIEIQAGAAAVESPTGTKPAYASADHAAQALGYMPRRNAMEIALDYLDAARGGG